MRISDWSSDVCSSDLQVLVAVNEEAAALITGTQVGSTLLQAGSIRTFAGEQRFVAAVVEVEQDGACVPGRAPQLAFAVLTQTAVGDRTVDRKSVVSGTSVSVRVDLGASRIYKKKTHTEYSRRITNKTTQIT